MIPYCKLTANKVIVNGEVLSFSNVGEWKKNIYSELELEYPKYYKMDDLSKMTILAVELLLRKNPELSFEEDELTLIFANQAASERTDNKFIESYKEAGNPSPSLFVYTLPNILTGELAIKHKWYGENVFFISKNFDADLYKQQINRYFSTGSEACLCGWVNTDKDEAFIFLVDKTKDAVSATDLMNIYDQK